MNIINTLHLFTYLFIYLFKCKQPYGDWRLLSCHIDIWDLIQSLLDYLICPGKSSAMTMLTLSHVYPENKSIKFENLPQNDILKISLFLNFCAFHTPSSSSWPSPSALPIPLLQISYILSCRLGPIQSRLCTQISLSAS